MGATRVNLQPLVVSLAAQRLSLHSPALCLARQPRNPRPRDPCSEIPRRQRSLRRVEACSDLQPRKPRRNLKRPAVSLGSQPPPNLSKQAVSLARQQLNQRRQRAEVSLATPQLHNNSRRVACSGRRRISQRRQEDCLALRRHRTSLRREEVCSAHLHNSSSSLKQVVVSLAIQRQTPTPATCFLKRPNPLRRAVDSLGTRLRTPTLEVACFHRQQSPPQQVAYCLFCPLHNQAQTNRR